MKKVTIAFTTLAALVAAPAAFAQATPAQGGSSTGSASGSVHSTTHSTTPSTGSASGSIGTSGGSIGTSGSSGATAAQPMVTTPPPASIQTTKAPVGSTTITQADVTPAPPPSTSPRERETVTLKQTFHPNRPLLFTGGAIFLGSYVTTAALTAAKVNDDNDRGDRTMYIPVVGPWLHLADIKETGTDLALTIGSGVLQGAGIGMVAASLFIPEKVPAATIQAGNVKMNVLPTTYASGGGVGAVGQF